MEMYCAPQNNFLYRDYYNMSTPRYSLSPYYSQSSSYMTSSSSQSSYSQNSQSSYSPLPSSPYTPLSQSSDSFGNDSVFKFPPVVQDQYNPTRQDLISLAIARAKNVLEIEEIGQQLITVEKRYVVQNNGQKTLLPPTTKKEPKRGSELYVALPKACLEGFIYAVFSQFGTVHQIRLMMHYSGVNRGYGYIMMSNPIEAEKALVKMAEYTYPGIRGPLLVSMSTDNRTLFARNIPMDLSEEQLKTEFENRVEGVKKVRVFNDPEDPGKNREFCFVIFNDHRNAALARRSMAESPFFMNKMPIKIQWAESEPVFRHSVLNRLKQLHLRNMNAQTTEDDMWKIVCQYVSPGNIVFIKKSNTCGRIKFVHHEYADIARKNLDGRRVHGISWIAMWDKIEGTKYENERYVKQSCPS